ncbi:hypothetical protein BJ944DRAFT_160737 [Cunninghamella echinulata]|nr:hypothetical protein BJ944DRAFT_160737 [Cunninghamella echinulata]
MTNNTDNSKELEWLPLEANPEIIHQLGVDSKCHYVDVLAMIFLSPTSELYDQYRNQEDIRLNKLEQSISPNVIYFKQSIRNACGMIALLHSIANNEENEIIGPGELQTFLEQAQSMSPDERAEWLKQSNELRLLHETAARSGQTTIPQLGDQINFHYACFVEVDDHLYELDGSRSLPINHGRVTNFVESAAKVIKQYMAIDPNQTRFNIIALVKTN